MRVLVTRPRGDAEETAAQIAALGHDAVIGSLLDIRHRTGLDIPLDGVQAVLATSANGIRALAERSPRRDVKVLAVGAQSAQAARVAGFAHVEHAAGDAAALATLVVERLAPEGGALFHASGAETRGTLAKTLTAKGFALRSAVLYEAVAAGTLPRAAYDALSEGCLDAALFYSPRTAGIFAALVAQAGIGQACHAVAAICISQAAADALKPVVFRTVLVAARPTQEALLALLS